MTPTRPERADKARNRARILASASEAFAISGLDVQMDEIAVRAGVGVGTLYGHFATKDALMLALIERKYEMLLDIAQVGVGRDNAEPFDILADVLRQSAAITAADAGTRDALMRADEAMLAPIAETIARLSDTVQLLIDRARASNAVRSDLTANDISLLMHGVAATMGYPNRDWRRFLELALDGIRGSSGPKT
jgi:AcrR family transcriptional regulator